ncbi:MAG: flagellar basal body-associated protein FliL [Massilia sp.]
MKADPKAKAEAAPSGSKKKLIVLIAGAVLVLGAGGGAAAFFLKGDDAHAPAKKERKAAKVAPPEYVAVEPFTVNLQPENGDQYLQIQFTLQVEGPEQVELFKANMAQVRSRVLLLLSGKKASEINTIDGKRQLAGEILAALKQPFVDKGEPQEVVDVLFTSFIIQ